MNRTRLGPKTAIAMFVLICLIVDLCPRYGRPDFRYTGSDPANAVWNIGWPVALFIYDAQCGWQIGPFAVLVLPFQFVVLLTGLMVTALRRLRRAQERDS